VVHGDKIQWVELKNNWIKTNLNFFDLIRFYSIGILLMIALIKTEYDKKLYR